MNAQRHLRIATIASIFLFLVLAGLTLFAGTTTSIAARGNTGKALAFQSLLAKDKKVLGASWSGGGLHRGLDGRFLLDPKLLNPGSHYSLNPQLIPNVSPVTGPVQTFDTFAPPDAFTTFNNQPRVASNFFPVWTNDEQYILFSSNRDASGAIAGDGSVFHIWAIPSGGGQAFQVTDSTPPANRNATSYHGELFPALSPGDNSLLAFTSDANSANHQQLYVIPFQSGQAVVNVTGLTDYQNALTLRTDVSLDFDNVARPTWGGDGQLAFSGHTFTGTYAGHNHIYILNYSTHGYAQSAYPAKLTNGPADDENPTWSPDGQFIVFDSTASGVTSTGLPISPGIPPGNGNPGTLDVSPVLTTAGPSLHNIIMLRSSGAIPLALSASSGLLTTPGNDDVDPAWSSGAANPYSNPRGDTEYLAFSRGAAASAPHDIYYLQATAQTFTPGTESGNSNTVTVESAPVGFPLYQINAGGPIAPPYIADTPALWSGGAVGAYPANGPAINTAGVTNPAPAAVYQTYRTATAAAPTITRTISNLSPNASYTLRLHFAEPTTIGPGQRTFNILLNGNLFASNFDIVANSGGQGVAVVVETGNAITDANGNLAISFASVNGFAIVNGIEVISNGSGLSTVSGTSAPGAPTLTATVGVQTVTLNWTAVPGATSYNVYRQGPTDTTFVLLRSNIQSTTFTDDTIINGLLYSYVVRSVTSSSSAITVTPESVSPVKKLNTQSSGSFFNFYPAWSPFRTAYSIVYESNRSVTYNQADGTPSETDISLPDGNANPTIGVGYFGLLQSQVLDVDPPILQRFNEKEIVHVNVGNAPILPSAGNNTGSSTHAIVPGFPVTFTVRMSDRVTGTSQVYIQIKDPDSKYQDDQGREHKVFVSDPAIAHNSPNPADSASQLLWNGKGTLGDYYDSHGFQIFNGVRFGQKGLLAGDDGGGFNVSIGKYQGPVMSTNVGERGLRKFNLFQDKDSSGKPLRGGVPSQFFAYGAEYECEYINPTVSLPGSNATDYGTPYYLAGYDDRTPFTGDATHTESGAPRPTSEWLPLTLSTQQDNKGGQLYTGTWTVPSNTVSDYYLDVIAYNSAAYPFAQSVNTQGFTSGNWRIYDNVWGCTSRALDTSKDILVVSDDMLGQKFTGTSFGGHQRFLSNLRPVYFGGESYVTDVDVALLPDSSYYYDSSPQVYIAPMYNPVLNGLGVNSYFDSVIDDQARTSEPAPDGLGGYPIVKSQQYSIWRTLCHDPIDAGVLSNYLSNKTSSQPAVPAVDSGLGADVGAGNVPIATRCVLWFSPFSNDLFVGPGTLSDPSIQQLLTNFTTAGGRLLVSGQDVASQNPGSAFVNSTLNVSLVSDTGGTPLLSSGPNNILGFNNSWISNDFRQTIKWRTDGALSELGPSPTPFFNGPDGSTQYITGAIDTVKPNATASTDLIFNGGTNAGLVYTESAANNGSRVVYASFGLEGISQEVVKVGDTDALSPRNFHFESHNYRTNTLHNIVSYLRTGSFTGQIKDTTKTGDQNVSGALVYAVPTGGQLGTRAVYSATTVEGQYTIDGVPPGTYNIFAAKQGYLQAQSPQPVTVEGDVTVDVGLIISPVSDASIRGIVTDFYTGKALSGATVTFTAEDDPSVKLSAISGADGTYFIQHIPAFAGGRTYDGVASLAPTYPVTYPQAVTVSPGQTVDGTTAVVGSPAANANFILIPVPATITGRVFDNSTGTGIGGATITVSINNVLISQTATTNADGTYTLKLGPDSYTLTAKATGYSSATRNVTVTSGQKLTGQDFGLDKVPPGYIGGSVINQATGQPVVGLAVKIFAVGATTPIATFTTTATKSPAPPAGDGKPLNYVGAIPEGTYTVSATDSTLGAAAPVQTGSITVTRNTFTRVDLTFSLGTLGGLVKPGPNSAPLSGVTVTITTAAGAAVATVTTGAVTSPNAPTGDGAPQNYHAFLPAGTYNITFTKSGLTASPAFQQTIAVGAFTRQDYTAPVLTTFPAGLQMISSPYDYSSFSLDALFGTDRSKLVIWQPQLLEYVVDPTPPADNLHLGYGYWIKLPHPVDFAFKGTPASSGTVSVPLHAYWNQIGNPSTTAINLTDLKFLNPLTPGTTLTFTDASSIKYNLVSPTVYGYDQASNSYVKVTTLQPWHGYWMKVYADTTVYMPVVNQ